MIPYLNTKNCGAVYKKLSCSLFFNCDTIHNVTIIAVQLTAYVFQPVS